MPDDGLQVMQRGIGESPAGSSSRHDRPSLVAFITDARSEETLRDGLSEFAHDRMDVRRGDVRAAVAAMQKQVTPKVLIIDVSGEDQPLSALSDLSNVVEPDVCVLVVGELSGSPVAYRYVRYNSTTNAAWLAEPAPVYWVDAAHTTVTGTFSEGLTATSADIAGYAMPNTTDLSQFTGAQLATAVNGNFIWIQVFGRILGAFAPGSTAVGDLLIGATGNFTSARIANHATQTADTPLAWATTAVSSSKSNQWVVVEY